MSQPPPFSPVSEREGPLKGIRVLDATRFQAGPSATRRLADYGATVVKLEQPGIGDPGRSISLVNGYPMFFNAFNRNKRSVELDLKDPEHRPFLFKLVEWADVFVENFKAGQLDSWGLTYDVLRRHNARLILASSSGYGPTGPWSKLGAFDMATQAVSGAMVANGGGPSHEPRVSEWALADEVGGMNLAFGVLSALVARARTGVGQQLQTSQLGAMIELQVNGSGLTRALVDGGKQNDSGDPPFIHNAYRQTYYQCSDGTWMVIAAIMQSDWERMLRALGLEQLLHDPRQTTVVDRAKHTKYWKQLLSTVIAAEPRDYWISKLQAASVVAAPVLSYAEVIAEPHMWENGYLTHMEVPGHGTKRVQGVAIRFAGTPVPSTMAAGPALGADTAAFETLLRSDGGVTRPSKL